MTTPAPSTSLTIELTHDVRQALDQIAARTGLSHERAVTQLILDSGKASQAPVDDDGLETDELNSANDV